MCASKTKRGNDCPYRAKSQYNGQWYCQKHLRVNKSTEECSICFVDMCDKRDRIELSCGHFFHIRCLSQCHKATCPLCRKQFSSSESYAIFKSTVTKPIFHSLFNLPTDFHGLLVNLFRSTLLLSQRGRWYLEIVYTFVTVFENYTKDINAFSTAFEYFIFSIQNQP